MFIYLFSNEHRNIIGLYKLPIEYMAADIGEPFRKVKDTVSELYSKDLIAYDPDTELVLVKGFLEHNPLQNPKMEKCAIKTFAELPKSLIFQDFLTVLEQLPKQYADLIHTVSDTVSTKN